MALSRVHTWSAGEILLASDLNAEFNNPLTNALSLISPLTGNLAGGGFQINNIIIGASTPLAGSFTTLSATGTATLAGLIDASGAAAGQIKFPATQNASSNANTLDDYAEASFTGTLTGGTTAPTNTVNVTKIGNQVTIDLAAAYTVTSNATTKTITGMPAAYRPTTAKKFMARVADNGGAFAAAQAVLGTDGVLTFFSAVAGTAWTNSGTATIDVFCFTYTLN